MLLQSEGGAEPRVETAKAARELGAGVFKFRLLLVGDNGDVHFLRASALSKKNNF